jgi:hypothetical protein
MLLSVPWRVSFSTCQSFLYPAFTSWLGSKLQIRGWLVHCVGTWISLDLQAFTLAQFPIENISCQDCLYAGFQQGEWMTRVRSQCVWNCFVGCWFYSHCAARCGEMCGKWFLPGFFVLRYVAGVRLMTVDKAGSPILSTTVLLSKLTLLIAQQCHVWGRRLGCKRRACSMWTFEWSQLFRHIYVRAVMMTELSFR